MKTKMMRRVAVVVLAIALLTTTILCGTMAKYVTETSVTDGARVAYWGFDQQKKTQLTFNLFEKSYDSINSQDGADVVAPGQSYSTSFNFHYTDNGETITAPEVDYYFEIDFVASGDYAALDGNTNFVWELTMPNDTKVQYDTVAELETAIESLNKVKTDDAEDKYTAGSLPGKMDAGDNTITIGWAWTYSFDEVGDVADTTMGNATGDLDNVTFDITVTATQAD